MVCPYRSTPLILFAFCIILVLIFFSPLKPFAKEINGEIINVNYKYKIAFTDLTDEQLKKGDIVGIYRDGVLIAYMEVITPGSVISKLSWKERLGKYKNSVDFNKVNIGDIVVKLQDKSILYKHVNSDSEVNLSESERVKPTQIISDNLYGNDKGKYREGICEENKELDKQFKQLSANYATLSETLKELMNENKELDAENKELRQRLQEKEGNIKILKEQNLTCKNELTHIRSLLVNCNQNQNSQKIKELKEILLKLRQKIKYLEKLLSGE